MPRLSIVMCNYNHEKYLTESIDAILLQSYKDFELIVVEDGSTDNSLQVLREYSKKDSRVKIYVNQFNMGVLRSANKGLSHAKGEYVYFAASDDRICQDFFYKTLSLFSKYPQAGICSGLIYLIDEFGKNAGWVSTPILSNNDLYLNPVEACKKLETIGSWFAGQTVVYKKKCFEELSLKFDPDLLHRADHFVNYVIAAKFGACFYPEIKASYRLLSTGYAETVFANDKLSRESLSLLIDKMRDKEFNDFLPSQLVNAVEKRTLHEIEIRAIKELEVMNLALIERLACIAPSQISTAKKIPLIILKKFIVLYYFILKAYIYIKRMNGEMDWLIDRYRQAKFNNKYNKENQK